MDLFYTLTSKSNVKSALQVGLKQTLHILTSYLSLEKLEENDIQDDSEFLIINDEEYANKLRGKCLQIVKQLIDLYGEYCMSTLLSCVKNALIYKARPNQFKSFDFEMVDLFNFSYETDNSDYYWKKCEGVLLLLGYINEDIIFYCKKAKDSMFEQIYQYLLSSSIAKHFSSHKPLLGRLLWNLSMVSEQLTHNKKLSEIALSLAIKSIIYEKSISIKLSALWVVVRYSSYIQWGNEKSKDDLMIVVKNINYLITSISPSLLSYPLEALKLFAKESYDLFIHGCSQIYNTIFSLIDTYVGDDVDDTKLLDLLLLLAKSNRKQFTDLFWCKAKSIITNYSHADTKASQYGLKIISETLHCIIENSTQIPINEYITFMADTINSTEDAPLLNSMTWLIRSITFKYCKQIQSSNLTKQILDACIYLFKPTILENALMNLGYLIIIIFNKLIPSIDTQILFEVIKKSYRARMPSVVQSLVLIFAKLIVTHPQEILSFLTETSFESRISLKILLDKWLLHQPLFRGKITVFTTIYALTKLFQIKDQRIETLRVITYNPSHSNTNSEVNAPFKILCTLLRYIDNETIKRTISPNDILKGEQEEGMGSPIATMLSPNANSNEKDMSESKEGAIKVKWDDVKNEEDNPEQIMDIEKNFDIKESKDKGLADVETGSTYYMSEMLAFDFDECADNDEMYEDDIGSLDDLVLPSSMEYTTKLLKDMSKADGKYIDLCLKHLLDSDQQLYRKYIL